MNEEDRNKLRRSRTFLVKDLDTKNILDALYSKNILSAEDVERINAQMTRADRVRLLLDILPTKGPKAFQGFIESLNDDFPWIVERLQGC
jgi:CASP2 and RIPK1 domain-containing adaptor